MNDQDLRVKSVDTALEWTKQIITLSAGILVVSGTFIKDLFNGEFVYVGFLVTSWLTLCISILAGLLFMGALCSLLATKPIGEISIYSSPARSVGLVHFASFFLAMVCFAAFALKNLQPKPTNKTETPAVSKAIAPNESKREKSRAEAEKVSDLERRIKKLEKRVSHLKRHNRKHQ